MPRIACIVEDEPSTRATASILLEDLGFTVRAFETADEALSYLSRHAEFVTTLFTDVRLPGKLDGLDLAKLAVERWPWMAVLVTSGGLDAETNLPDGSLFLQKPWMPSEVIALVH